MCKIKRIQINIFANSFSESFNLPGLYLPPQKCVEMSSTCVLASLTKA